MSDVRRGPLTKIEDGRGRRISRAVAARRHLDRSPLPTMPGDGDRPRAGGRVWLNGVELGGTDPRHGTLGASYD